MTKLIEWLCGLIALAAVWIYLLTSSNFTSEGKQLILYSPIILVASFGIYAGVVVLYRVYTFNNCEEAALELQKEIKEAHIELNKLGFKTK